MRVRTDDQLTQPENRTMQQPFVRSLTQENAYGKPNDATTMSAVADAVVSSLILSLSIF